MDIKALLAAFISAAASFAKNGSNLFILVGLLAALLNVQVILLSYKLKRLRMRFAQLAEQSADTALAAGLLRELQAISSAEESSIFLQRLASDKTLQNKAWLNIWHAEAYCKRAKIFESKQPPQLQQALRDYEKALQHNPFHSGALYRQALIYAQNGWIQAEKSNYNRILNKYPYHCQALANRAFLALAEKQNYQEALADCEKALQENPNFSKAHFVNAWLNVRCGLTSPSAEAAQYFLEQADKSAKHCPAALKDWPEFYEERAKLARKAAL